MGLLRWPTDVTAKEITSRQKEKGPRQKEKTQRPKKKPPSSRALFYAVRTLLFLLP